MPPLLCFERASNRAINGVADSGKAAVNIIVCEAQNANAERFHNFGARGVIFLRVVGEMLAAVQFDDQLCGGAIEIGDEGKNDCLTFELHRISAQKVIPKVLFVPRGVFS